MRNVTRILTTAGLFLAAIAGAAAACSTFCLEKDKKEGGSLVFARNYDWNVSDGLLMVNPAGAVKTAAVENNPANWKSRYGSVTFNQYGREYPCGGMNEAGLVVELMWLDETTYPTADARSAIPTLQWIQYQLDNAATVDEVLDSNLDVRIEGRSAQVHFLVADAAGAVASVEFIDGLLVAHTDASMPYAALTNDTYARSLSYLGEHRGYGGERGIRRSQSSLDRFVVAADRAAGYDPGDGDPITYAFDTLDMVAQPHTQWSIVYDIAARRVYLRTTLHRELRWLDLDDLDFSCRRAEARIVDMQAPIDGDMLPHLEPYTTAANQELMRSAFAQTRFLAHIPESDVQRAALYPETITCEPLESTSR